MSKGTTVQASITRNTVSKTNIFLRVFYKGVTYLKIEPTPESKRDLKASDGKWMDDTLTFTVIPGHDTRYVELIDTLYPKMDRSWSVDGSVGLGLGTDSDMIHQIVNITCKGIDEGLHPFICECVTSFFTEISERFPDSAINIGRVG